MVAREDFLVQQTLGEGCRGFKVSACSDMAAAEDDDDGGSIYGR